METGFNALNFNYSESSLLERIALAFAYLETFLINCAKFSHCFWLWL